MQGLSVEVLVVIDDVGQQRRAGDGSVESGVAVGGDGGSEGGFVGGGAAKSFVKSDRGRRRGRSWGCRRAGLLWLRCLLRWSRKSNDSCQDSAGSDIAELGSL